MSPNKLPMRSGVGVIILNKENKVFVGKRKDNPVDNWQMPQGGVDKNEDFISAMRRELFEETSIRNIKILKEIDGFFEYELPKIFLVLFGKESLGDKDKNGLLQDLAVKIKKLI